MILEESCVFSSGGDELSEVFSGKISEVRSLFFGRNPKKWPVFAEPGISEVLEFRQNHIHAAEQLAAYENGAEKLEELKNDTEIPAGWSNGQSQDLLNFVASMSKNWENPAAVENVVTMSSDPAIYGAVMASVANPNLVYSEYAGMAEELERVVVKQMANLVGYDPEQATGVFTQGGTFCNMYGYLFGIRKSLPQSRHLGLEYGQDYRIINSQGGHYSNTTNLSVLGVNLDKKTIRIKLTEDNDMDVADLRDQLEACFRLGCVVPTIMLTMGTTDTFGVDRVKPVYDLVQDLCEEYEVDVKPHIHVDAAVGWPLIFFLDYDFATNPIGINEVTLAGLKRNVGRFQELKFADSFTVDFQKWGYVPYTSSLVMVKDKSSMQALEHDPENFSYFEKDVQGQTHLQSTIECSRGAAGVFGAYHALKCMGKEGYQVIIAHGLQNANYFRAKLAEMPNVKVIANRNQGPSVGFRVYDPSLVSDANTEFAYEKAFEKTEEYEQRVAQNTAYHRHSFLSRGKKYLYTNWVEYISQTNYDEKRRWGRIPGEKAVFMHPLTDRAQIDCFVAELKG